MVSGFIKVILLISLSTVLCDNHDLKQILAKSIHKFGDTLYKELAKQSGNIAFSPFSLHSAMSLLTLGAVENTRTLLLSKLSIPNVATLKKGYVSIMKENNKMESYLKIAKTIVVSQNYSLRPTFAANASKIFQATPQVVDFAKAEEAAGIINGWISNKTNHTIEEFIKPSSIDAQSMLILLNAMYFKGSWSKQFDKTQTIKDSVFHAPDKNVKCEMMYMPKTAQKLLTNKNYSMLELPFEGINVSMVFIRPHLKSNITHLERILRSERVLESIGHLRETTIDVKIPKFRLDFNYNLKEHLRKVGLGALFTYPNFRNLLMQSNDVKLSQVQQKTMVEVTEEGATVVALTRMHLVGRSQSMDNMQFVLDKPFLFFLYDKTSNIILMRGRVDNPTLT